MLTLEEGYVEIPKPEPIQEEQPVKKVAKPQKKVPTFHAFCKYCKKDWELKQKQLIIRCKYGIPINSFYCPSCKRRNFFISEKYSLDENTLNLLKQFPER